MLPLRAVSPVVLVLVLFAAATLPVLLSGGRDATAQQADASLVSGGNYVAYDGATLPVEDALNDAVAVVSAVWWFDQQQGEWAGWNPSLPAALQAFSTLTSGQPVVQALEVLNGPDKPLAAGKK